MRCGFILYCDYKLIEKAAPLLNLNGIIPTRIGKYYPILVMPLRLVKLYRKIEQNKVHSYANQPSNSHTVQVSLKSIKSAMSKWLKTVLLKLFRECKTYSDNPLCDYQHNSGNSSDPAYAFGPGISSASWQLVLALIGLASQILKSIH